MATSNRPTTVANISGDFEESVLRLAKHLGRDKNRRAVFGIIYGRGSKPLSKKQIAERLGIAAGAQIVQNSLDHLASHHLIVRIENDGHVKDGSRWVYGKNENVRVNRGPIEKYADDPVAAKKVATKRRPALLAVSFVKPSGRTRPSSTGTRAVKSKARLKIAVLVTNPDTRASLQTGIEARDIKTAVRLAERRDAIDLKVFFAPTLDALIDMLNEYRPTVIHFAGHGGAGALLFDNERAGQDGGMSLDFGIIARVIAATSAKPSLMVLAACDTVEGAECFLDGVRAVIAMSAAIDDVAAVEFSRRFYRSLSGGATIAHSLEQTRLWLEQQGYADASLPTLITRDPASADNVLL